MSAPALPAQANRTLVAMLVAMVAMLFTAFAASYLERQAATETWVRIPLPSLLWINTGVLLLSSVAVEAARRRRAASRRWIGVTLGLGALFLLGQLAVWFLLRADGIFLPSSPHASFFYVLTGVHGVHLLGGLIALLVAISRPRLLDLAAGFWHFMGALWLYVLVVLAVLC